MLAHILHLIWFQVSVGLNLKKTLSQRLMYPSPQTSDQPAPNQQLAIGLGVGIGVGAPVILMCVAILIILLFIRNDMKKRYYIMR